VNEEQIEKVLEQFEEIQREGAKIARYLAELKYGERPLPFDADEIILEDGLNLCASWTTYDRCSDYREEHDVYIPTSYLFNDTIVEELEEKIRAVQTEKEEKKKQEALDRKAAADKHDYEKFMELSEKFGGNNG